MKKQAEFCSICHNAIAKDPEYGEWYHLDTGLYGCPVIPTERMHPEAIAVATPGGRAKG
jgi:hypothetical protein